MTQYIRCCPIQQLVLNRKCFAYSNIIISTSYVTDTSCTLLLSPTLYVLCLCTLNLINFVETEICIIENNNKKKPLNNSCHFDWS